MIPFYDNAISRFNLKNKRTLSARGFEEEIKKSNNSKMEAVVNYCVESLNHFQEVKIQTFQTWKLLNRLCLRCEVFNQFLKDLKENPTMLNDLQDTENEILLGIQKTFRAMDKLFEDVLKRKTIKGFTEPAIFQSHINDIANVNGMVQQYAEALNVLDEPDLTQIRSDDLDDIKETFKYAITESLREIADDGMDKTKKNFKITEEIRNLQRDIQAAEDAVVKLLSLRKERALSVFEARALKGELQKLSLIITEKGAEIEYSRKQQEIDTNGVNISTDFEDRDEIVIGPITKNFIYRFNRNILSNNDLYRKKEYLERERLLYDEVTITDTILMNWAHGEVMLGKFQNKDVTIKMMTKTSNKNHNENQKKILENELLTLVYLNKTPRILECYGCLMKETQLIHLVLELPPYGTLEDMLSDEINFPTFPLPLKFAWILDLAEALDVLYRNDVTHGDMQAKNLFVFEKMRLKLGNFHILRTSLHNLTPTNNNGPQPLSTPLRSSRDLNAASNDPLKRSPPRGHNDPSLPFLPPEARTGKEVDISFDIFSFAMTVIQILTRKTPLLDNFQQQIVHALHVSGCNAMDIRNRLFSLLSDCVKFEPGTEPKETRPPSNKILNEMNHIVKILGGDPRAQESQSTYLGKLEAMALEKRKQNERKKSSSSDRERNQFAAPYDYYNNNSTHSLTTMSQNSFQSSISSKPDNYYNEPALIPESFDDNDDGMPLGRSEKGYPGAFPDIPLSPNISRSFPKEMAPQGISPPPLMRSSDSFSITSGENSRRLSANKPVQQPPNNLSTKSRSAKFLDQSSLGCSSNDSYQSLDNENISVLATFLRDKVKCTNSFAKKAASTLVKNGILDVEILKRRLARDRELLFKLGLDEDLAEDIYEIVLGTAQQAPPQPQSQNNISRYFSSNMSIGSNNSIMTSSKLFSPAFFGNNSSNKQSSYSLTYCQTEQQAAEVALHYYDASQCNRTSSLQKLKDLASGGDQIAEGFLMRIYALGQCGQPKDFEKASKMGEKLYPWLQLMVQNGSELRSIYARYHLAVCHSEGLGVPKDMKVALGWYKECAERGYAGAQAYLGFCYYMGIGVEKNHPEAVRWYRIAADQGFSGAQANLGICYEHGHGVAKNYDLALKYYRLSAEQGASSAQYNLGNLYERSEGVDQNFYEAAKWYIQSANQSYTPAEYSIGCFYLVGLGIEEDIELGIEFLTKAAEKNYILAQVKLGECFEQGNGVQKNPLRAIKWYYRAAEQGNPAALYYIGYYHFYGITVERDLSKAVEFYTLAAERGHAVAQNNLAICYQNGFGIKKDVVLAMKYFREAAIAGYSQAQFNLGQCYEKGSGVGKSLQEAIKYYKIAAQNDNANAKQALTRLHIQTPLQFDRHPTEDFVRSEA